MKILLSGICGFAGSTIAHGLLDHDSALELIGLDNLSRAGSHLNIEPLRQRGVKLIHADLRSPSDLESIAKVDWIIDAAANPSVLAGIDGATSSRQVIEHNLYGTVNLLELAKRHRAGFILLSTSRVYSIKSLADIPVVAMDDRFEPDCSAVLPQGVSSRGIAENFATTPPLSLYGSSKLASECLALEYGEMFEFPVWINRCGVLAGAGQFGRADQGIFSFWINAYLRRAPLRYIGFDGSGASNSGLSSSARSASGVTKAVLLGGNGKAAHHEFWRRNGKQHVARAIERMVCETFRTSSGRKRSEAAPIRCSLAGDGFAFGRGNLGLATHYVAGSDPGRDRRARGSTSGLAGNVGCAMSAASLSETELKVLSVVIPARDEEGCIASTVEHLHIELRLNNIPHEIVVVDDGSTDRTWEILQDLRTRIATLAPTQNPGPNGFGRAVTWGLDQMKGDAVVIMMADESDDCRDVVRYWNRLNEGYDCVFGSRFVKGGGVIDYPKIKLFLNRLANFFLKVLFRIKLNDTTNAFKAYRKDVIDGCRPLIAPHFNITVEIPLKAIVRGFSWTTIPITWRNRRTGTPKLKIQGDGQPLSFHLPLRLARKILQQGGLQTDRSSSCLYCPAPARYDDHVKRPELCDTARRRFAEPPHICNERKATSAPH